MARMKIFTACLMISFLGISCASRAVPTSSFGPYSAAETYYTKGNYPKAIEKYQEYLALNPQGNMAAISEYYIGKSHVLSGDAAKACESFERVVTQYPKTSWAEFSKEQLELLKTPAEA